MSWNLIFTNSGHNFIAVRREAVAAVHYHPVGQCTPCAAPLPESMTKGIENPHHLVFFSVHGNILSQAVVSRADAVTLVESMGCKDPR